MQVSCCSYAEQAGQLAAVDDQEAEERRRALGGQLRAQHAQEAQSQPLARQPRLPLA